MDDDAILKLEDFERYVMKELRIVKCLKKGLRKLDFNT